MKNKDTISAIVGSAFFGVSYLALSVPILPALAIGTSAFIAGELVFTKNNSKKSSYENIDIKKVLEKAKKQNNYIKEVKKTIDDETLRKYITEINVTTSKIINKIESQPNKIKSIDNFFDYYLPITVKIIDRYNEIEDQNLSSKEVQKFIDKTNNMLLAVSNAFKNILNSLYHEEIIDMDAEMKVFSSMLKADGLNEDELNIKKEEK